MSIINALFDRGRALSEDGVSIVIPAKNEAENLPAFSERLMALAKANSWQCILVDDGSDDGTGDLAESLGFTVVRHPYSKGNGAAVKSGARSARGNILVFMDGDGQHQPEDIPRLLEKMDQGYDLVVGARTADQQASLMRRLANGFYNRFSSWMVGHKIGDLTSGFRAFRREKFMEFISFLPNGFSYPTTSTMSFFRAGYNVCYIPINVLQRGGKSHINLWRDGVKFLLIIFRVGTLYSPLKLFFPIAMALFASGMTYFLAIYLLMGRFTNMSVVLILSAVLVFVLGLLSEQITTLLYKENQQSNRQQEQ